MQPQLSMFISDKKFRRLFWVLPVAATNLVACDAQLAPHADRYDSVFMICDLDASMWQYSTNGCKPRM